MNKKELLEGLSTRLGNIKTDRETHIQIISILQAYSKAIEEENKKDQEDVTDDT